MLNIENVSINTRHSVYKNVSYSFSPGQIYGIVAINGAGKTTLFRAIMDLIPCQNGKITLANKPISKHKRHIFYFEASSWLDGNLNGLDYLNFVKESWRSNVDIDDIIQTWKMDYIKVPIRKYSLGMKQRLVIAMYLVSNAKYMIMDELTNGLDEYNRTLFFNTLKQLKDNGHMILLSSQYAQDLQMVCDHILTIENETLKEVDYV